jgi:hemoglobin
MNPDHEEIMYQRTEMCQAPLFSSFCYNKVDRCDRKKKGCPEHLSGHLCVGHTPPERGWIAEVDSEPVSPVLTADSQDADLYHALGGTDTCRRLSAAFYAHVEHDPVLRPLYPPTLKGCPIETLAAFLIQFFGGPCEYAQRRWWLSLREAHLRFAIGEKEREAWLNNMFQAVDEVNIKEPTRSALRWFFAQSSAFFINQPPEAANESLHSWNAPSGTRTSRRPLAFTRTSPGGGRHNGC